jgi:hypothetical protein
MRGERSKKRQRGRSGAALSVDDATTVSSNAHIEGHSMVAVDDVREKSVDSNETTNTMRQPKSKNRRIVEDSNRDSKSVKATIAKQHYEEYYKQEHGLKKAIAWANMKWEDFDTDNIERFATFLCKKEGITSTNTVCGYLSSVRGLIEAHTNGGKEHPIAADDKKWRAINKEVTKQLGRKAAKEGRDRIVRKAEPLRLAYLTSIMHEFFEVR